MMKKIFVGILICSLGTEIWAESSFHDTVFSVFGRGQNLELDYKIEETQQDKVQNKNTRAARAPKLVRKCLRTKLGAYSCFMVWQ